MGSALALQNGGWLSLLGGRSCHLRVVEVRDVCFLVERFSLVGWARLKLGEELEGGVARVVETLIIIVIKRSILVRHLVVRLGSEVGASRVGFTDLWAVRGLLEGKAAFERLVGIVVGCFDGVAVGHRKVEVRFRVVRSSIEYIVII